MKTQTLDNKEFDKDLEIRELDAICVNESHLEHQWYHNLKYLVVGILFGIVFVKAEIISWFRIQEMFRLQSFHMYGVIGSAVVVGMISVFIIKKFICYFCCRLHNSTAISPEINDQISHTLFV